MPKQTWIIAGVLSGAVLLGIVFFSIRKQGYDNERLKRDLAAAQAALARQSSDLVTWESASPFQVNGLGYYEITQPISGERR